jgi:Beta-propeller repeat
MSVKALRCSYFLLFAILAFSGLSLAQSQSRYLAYSTYSPQAGFAPSYSAVNSGGVLCVAAAGLTKPTQSQYPSGVAEIYQLRPDGSLVFNKSTTIFNNTANGGPPGVVSGVDEAGSCYLAISSVPQAFPAPVPMTLQKYDSAGNLVFSVNYAGSGVQGPVGVAVDASKNIWLAGSTQSNDLQLVNPIQSTLKGSQNLFIAEFNSSGTLIFSTYLGGTGRDFAGGMAVDGSGNAYIAGTTSSTDFPTLNPLEPSVFGGDSRHRCRRGRSGRFRKYIRQWPAACETECRWIVGTLLS